MKNFIKLFLLFSISVFILSCGTDDEKCSSDEECGEGFECNIDTGKCEPKEGGDGTVDKKDDESSNDSESQESDSDS
ncbi:MAG TPA: hypothetical protein VLJ60_03445, partial [bacterium]|nr:hypothetical protein [bacterium]